MTKPAVRPSELDREVDAKGYFHRQKNHFTRPFSGENSNSVESGKYRLVWAKGCQWSNRASIVHELLGLEDAISITIVGHHEHDQNYGWEFINGENNCDKVLGTQFLSEVYYNTDPNYNGRPTVPALIDTKTKTIANNDYHWLTNYLEKDFKKYHAKNAPDLYPEDLREQIDEYNAFLFDHVNNAVYKAQFGQSLEAYNDAINIFYDSLDVIEKRLEKKRFLFGDYVTDSDVRLYVTLVRFDTRYYHNLGPLPHRIVDYKNIWAYVRDLYEIPAFQNNTYFHDIAYQKRQGNNIFQGYNARFWKDINFEEIWSAPQNRDELSAIPDEKFLREN